MQLNGRDICIPWEIPLIISSEADRGICLQILEMTPTFSGNWGGSSNPAHRLIPPVREGVWSTILPFDWEVFWPGRKGARIIGPEWRMSLFWRADNSVALPVETGNICTEHSTTVVNFCYFIWKAAYFFKVPFFKNPCSMMPNIGCPTSILFPQVCMLSIIKQMSSSDETQLWLKAFHFSAPCWLRWRWPFLCSSSADTGVQV